jgi:hypothetical protein
MLAKEPLARKGNRQKTVYGPFLSDAAAAKRRGGALPEENLGGASRFKPGTSEPSVDSFAQLKRCNSSSPLLSPTDGVLPKTRFANRDVLP